MNRLTLTLLATALVAAALFGLLYSRFRGDPEEETQEEGKGSGAKVKKGPKDFAKGKGGLVRTSDLDEGSRIDPNAPPNALGDYIDLRSRVLKKWRETKLTVEYEGLSLAEVLDDLLKQHGLEARLDPEAATSGITLRVEDMQAIAALDLMAKMGGLDIVINQAGEIWVVPAAKVNVYAPPASIDLAELSAVRQAILADRNAGLAREPELARKLRELSIAGGRVGETDLAGFLDFMTQMTEITYAIKPTDDPPRIKPVTGADGESVDAFLHRALDPVGYTFHVTENSVVVMSKQDYEAEKKTLQARDEERKGRLEVEKEFFRKVVTIGGEDLALRDVADALGAALAVPVVIDPRSWRRMARYTFNSSEKTAADIVAILKKGAPVEVTYRDGKLWFLAPEDLHESP